MYTFFFVTCGVSPFLYVLGMSEFRAKVEELFDDIWEVITSFWRKLFSFSCHNNQIQPSGEEILPLDNMENREELLPGTSGSGLNEGGRDSAC